jgi:hypothetical protein
MIVRKIYILSNFYDIEPEKTIVLGLEGTIIYISEEKLNCNNNNLDLLAVIEEDVSSDLGGKQPVKNYLYIRPYLNYLLLSLYPFFELILFSTLPESLTQIIT